MHGKLIKLHRCRAFVYNVHIHVRRRGTNIIGMASSTEAACLKLAKTHLRVYKLYLVIALSLTCKVTVSTPSDDHPWVWEV